MSSILAQVGRGEPLTVAAILIAVFGELGMQLAPGDADSLVASGGRVATILVGLWLARRHTTPAVNPLDPAVGRAGARQPVITFRGKRQG